MAQDQLVERTGPRRSAASRLRSTGATALRSQLAIKIGALLVLAAVFTVLTDRFMTPTNLTNILRQISPVVICGCAVTMLMVSRAFDLSVSGVFVLAGVAAAALAGVFPVPIAFALAMGLGALVGLLNGTLVVGVGVNAVIATLGTMYVARGASMLFTGGLSIQTVPAGFDWLGTGFIYGVPIPLYVMALAMVVFIFLERRTLLGKYSVAIGGNPDAAYLAGVPVSRIRVVLFTLSGMMAGLAGVLMASRLSAGIPTVGVGFEFDVIVATILGGTSLAGGEGTVFGMFIGALIVGVLNNGLNIVGVQAFWQTVAMGLVLVIAVAFDAQVRKRRLLVRSGS